MITSDCGIVTIYHKIHTSLYYQYLIEVFKIFKGFDDISDDTFLVELYLT